MTVITDLKNCEYYSTDLIFSNMAPGMNNVQNNSNTNNVNTNTMDIQSPRPVLPCFIFTSETGKIDGYTFSRIICETSGDDSLRTLQETKNLWRVYCKSEIAKTSLITQGISLNGKHIKVYAQNPYVTGALNAGLLNNTESEQVEMVKVTIKDLLESVSNDEVMHFLTKVLRLEVTSDIQSGFYRDKRGGLTSLGNGDRIIWIHPEQLKHPLPRNAFIGSRSVRIFHRNQFDRDNECYNCFKTDHQSRNCPNEKACRVCKEPGHDPGSPDCTHYNAGVDIMAIGGYLDPLSNHYKAPFLHNHIPAKTVENHWFYNKSNKNGQPELATLCLEAKDGGRAKSLSKSILCASDWDHGDLAYNLMKDIVRSKIHQVQAAKDKLHYAWKNGLHIVEAVPNPKDLWWGSSLDKEGTIHTKPEHWPGQNKLGQILMELADEIFGVRQVWAEGQPGMPKGLEDIMNEEKSENEEDENDEEDEDDEEEEEEEEEKEEKEGEEQSEPKDSLKSASVKVSGSVEPDQDISASQNAKKACEISKDKGKESETPLAMVPSEEQIEAYLKKANYASKLREKCDARGRSKSPKTKKSKKVGSSPRTPSKKRSPISPQTSGKAKVAISEENVKVSSSSVCTEVKARFKEGSTNGS